MLDFSIFARIEALQMTFKEFIESSDKTIEVNYDGVRV